MVTTYFPQIVAEREICQMSIKCPCAGHRSCGDSGVLLSNGFSSLTEIRKDLKAQQRDVVNLG